MGPLVELLKEPFLWGIRHGKVCAIGGQNFKTTQFAPQTGFVGLCGTPKESSRYGLVLNMLKIVLKSLFFGSIMNVSS